VPSNERILRIDEVKIERVHTWFLSAGKWLLALGYFVPGVCHLIVIVRGTSRLELPVFALFAYGGGLVWSCLFIFAGSHLGKDWCALSGAVHHVQALLVPACIAAALGIVWWRQQRARTDPPTHQLYRSNACTSVECCRIVG
jgi:membrane protein DedA with SNARE-associated domain